MAEEISYTIRLASPGDVDAVLRARYRVYVETDGLLQPNEFQRISDRFDFCENTSHLIAETDGRIVGAVRLTTWSVAGLPAFDYFDFSSCLPQPDARVANGSLVFVDRPFRRTPVGRQLMAHFHAEAIAADCTTVIGVINPPLMPWFLELGYRQVGALSEDAKNKVPFLPVLLDMETLPAEAARAARCLGPLSSAGRRYRLTERTADFAE